MQKLLLASLSELAVSLVIFYVSEIQKPSHERHRVVPEIKTYPFPVKKIPPAMKVQPVISAESPKKGKPGYRESPFLILCLFQKHNIKAFLISLACNPEFMQEELSFRHFQFFVAVIGFHKVQNPLYGDSVRTGQFPLFVKPGYNLFKIKYFRSKFIYPLILFRRCNNI